MPQAVAQSIQFVVAHTLEIIGAAFVVSIVIGMIRSAIMGEL